MTPLYARHKRTTLAIATAVAAGALLATGMTTGAAAQTAALPTGKTTPLAGSPVQLSSSARTALIQKADAATAETAQEIGLGAKEKLVVRDVVQDTDGTVHTRYERTYNGLPVLGGDLVVHETKAGKTEGVSKATKATIKVSSLKAAVTTAKAEKQALTAAKDAGSAKTSADQAPRKVIWAATGKPALAYETVVGGLQDDGTPNELHVITDAATGKKLYE
ncbi:peptidase M4 family protein, partial [Streptomyces sp. NPDC006173]